MTIQETQAQILKETVKCSNSKLKINFAEDFEDISFIVILRGQNIISHRVIRETFPAIKNRRRNAEFGSLQHNTKIKDPIL
jgi:hypothetical protein